MVTRVSGSLVPVFPVLPQFSDVVCPPVAKTSKLHQSLKNRKNLVELRNENKKKDEDRKKTEKLKYIDLGCFCRTAPLLFLPPLPIFRIPI